MGFIRGFKKPKHPSKEHRNKQHTQQRCRDHATDDTHPQGMLTGGAGTRGDRQGYNPQIKAIDVIMIGLKRNLAA